MCNVLNLKGEEIETSELAESFLVFSNPGLLDLNAVRIMGVSVKESENPIGFFGTGLKYAIATILRLGGRIEVYIDGHRHEITSREITIRTQAFQQVMLDGEPLGFTTDLGKQWEPWMAVRELLSNARDESGQVLAMDSIPDQLAGKTVLCVYGPAFLDVWEERDKYFLKHMDPEHESDSCDFYPHTCGTNPSVFYKGIRVHRSTAPMMHTYNLRANILLTEDRTLMYDHQLNDNVCRTVVRSNDEAMIEKMLVPPEICWETKLNFDITESPSRTFLEVARRLKRQNPKGLNMAAIRYARKHDGDKGDDLKVIEPTAVQQKMLDRSKEFLAGMGYEDELEDMPILLVSWLGEGVMGQAKHGKIYLCKDVFVNGTKYLASTILEEIIHIKTGFNDHSRELQTHLFDKIVTLGEEMRGEPL